MDLMKLGSALLLLLLLITSGCAHSPAIQPLPYQHKMFDYQVAWKATTAGNSVSVEGLLKNVRWAYVYSVDLTIDLLKQNGTRISGGDLPAPQESREGDSVPFEVVLKDSTLEQGDQLEFVIRYKATEGQDGGIDWMSSFRVNALTGQVVKRNE